jgi:hypothetical protein
MQLAPEEHSVRCRANLRVLDIGFDLVAAQGSRGPGRTKRVHGMHCTGTRLVALSSAALHAHLLRADT